MSQECLHELRSLSQSNQNNNPKNDISPPSFSTTPTPILHPCRDKVVHEPVLACHLLSHGPKAVDTEAALAEAQEEAPGEVTVDLVHHPGPLLAVLLSLLLRTSCGNGVDQD